MRAGKDEDSLIGICQQHLLIIPLRPWVQPDDGARSFLDLLDHSAPIRQDRDLDSVANGRDITLCFALFEFAAQLTNDRALAGFNREETRLGFDNQTV
jgi:hypothetical protein